MGTRVGGEPGYRTTHVSRNPEGNFNNHTGNILVGKYRAVWLLRNRAAAAAAGRTFLGFAAGREPGCLPSRAVTHRILLGRQVGYERIRVQLSARNDARRTEKAKVYLRRFQYSLCLSLIFS